MLGETNYMQSLPAATTTSAANASIAATDILRQNTINSAVTGTTNSQPSWLGTYNNVLTMINQGSESVFNILSQINSLKNAQAQQELMLELQRSGKYTIPYNVYDMYPNLNSNYYQPMSEQSKWLLIGGAVLFLGVMLVTSRR